MRVWSHRERWKVGGEFLPWLFSIAYNICKNVWGQRCEGVKGKDSLRLL